MSMTSSLLSPLFQIPTIPVRRFSVDEYLRLIETGVLKEDDKVELLDGWITPKMARNPPHDSILVQVNMILSGLLPRNWHVRPQVAAVLPTSVPEPDLAIVAGHPRQYRNQHPSPAAAALFIEVADSSLAHDRNVKGPIYANAGVPVYWVVNVPDMIIEVYTSPAQGGYQNRQDYTVNDVVPLVIAGQTVAQVPVADLIG